jgi:hypothetical protein
MRAAAQKAWKIPMKIQVFLMAVMMMCGTIYAQTLNPEKDVAFGQMAAGGGYETVMAVTNRGTSSYSGIMRLYAGTGNPWNPIVNGTPITGGSVDVILNPGETKVFKITLPGGTEAGFAVVRAANLDQTSFIEGNVTYFARSGGTATESVGVSPSGEFYRSTLALDDLSTLALALVNLNGAEANVTLTVFDQNNQQLGSKTLDPLATNNHRAEFLAGRFSGLSGTRGRLEIESNVPILGTAMTAVGNLYSSLPLLASPYSYNFTTSIESIPLGGQIGVWHEGPYVKGYLRVTSAADQPMNPPATFLFHGVYTDGILRAGGVGQLAMLGNVTLEVAAEFRSFSLAAASATGTLRIIANGNSTSSSVSLTKIR